MIKEKYMPFVTIVAVLFAVAFLIVLLIGGKSTLTQPDYVTQVFDKNKVMQVNINIDDTQWQSLLNKAGDGEYVYCDITINNETYTNVGIRAKGNSSLSQVKNNPDTDRYSFRIEFDQYIQGQNLHGLKTLVLNAGNTDSTYMKEYLSYDMWSEMGVSTPAYSYANINLNDEPWGLYLAVEVLEESFLQRYYGNDYGNLYKPESAEMGGGGGEAPMMGVARPDNGRARPERGNFAPQEGDRIPQEDGAEPRQKVIVDRGVIGGFGGMGGGTGTSFVYTDDNISSYSGIFNYTITKKTSNANKSKLIESMKNLSTGTDLEKYIDVDEVLRYFAVNTFLVNLDSYAGSLKHNFYLYEQDGKVQILPWDADLSFGGFMTSDASQVINFPIDAPVTDSLENSPLIGKLLEVDEYKELYHKYLTELVDKYITSGKYESIINSVDQLISSYVENDTTTLNDFATYQNSLPQLKAYFVDRTKSITLQLAGEQPKTTYGTVETNMNTSALGSMGMGGNMGGDRNGGNLGGGGMPRNMPPMENIEKIMDIVQKVGDREFTTEEKEQLKELGADESMLETIKQMGARGEGIQIGIPTANNPNAAKEINLNLKNQILNLVLYFAIIIFGILFVINFKRKKYVRMN